MPPAPLSLFQQHPRHWRQNLYVYPVISRRSKGLSIGVNLNPDTACNFDCIYCCVDRTVPPAVREVDLDRLRLELDHLLHLAQSAQLFAEPPFDQTPPHLRRLNDVAFSGDGEPTAYPRFLDACRLVADLLADHNLPEAKIITITNATLLHRPQVAQALDFLDSHNGELWAKLDAGTEAYYHLVDRTTIPFQRILDNITAAARQRPIVIQSLFMNIDGAPPPAAEIDAYVARLRDMLARGARIKLVQIYTVARQTALPNITPLPEPTLTAIATQVRTTGLPTEIYP